MGYPDSYRYTKDHEWVRLEGSEAVMGITEFAQSELGEVVFVELPKIGTKVAKGDSLCVVESTKAASDVYAPVAGVVVEVNTVLEKTPSLLNATPHTEGWMVKLGEVQPADLEGLMDATAYENTLG